MWKAQSPVTPERWHGSLILGQRDASGLMYMRNRYYDPQTGRFTQEDPIGLAGGLNLYGFASGDPVNYSDPFGLCPKDAGGDGKTEGFADCPKGSSGYYANEDANGRGGFLNDLKGWVASCKESTSCATTAAVGAVITGEIVVSEVGAAIVGETAGTSGTITGATKHGINRIIERGVKPSEILDAVRNGEGIRAVDKAGRVSYRYVGEKATVVLNEAGKVISAWRGGW
jgi:RHS repeat-associated protein